MGANGCKKCGGGNGWRGSGRIWLPRLHWYEIPKLGMCSACGGDGYAKPPGWPDQAEIERLRPKPPSAPPPPKRSSVSDLLGETLDVMVAEHKNAISRANLAEHQRDNLLAGIRRLRDEWHGDDKCWLDVFSLFELLPEGFERPPRDTILDLRNCERFIARCHQPGPEYISDEQEIERLKAENKDLAGQLQGMTNCASAAVRVIDDIKNWTVKDSASFDDDWQRLADSVQRLREFEVGDAARALLTERDQLKEQLEAAVANLRQVGLFIESHKAIENAPFEFQEFLEDFPSIRFGLTEADRYQRKEEDEEEGDE